VDLADHLLQHFLRGRRLAQIALERQERAQFRILRAEQAEFVGCG